MQKQNDFAACREEKILNYMVDMARIRAMRSIAEYRFIRKFVDEGSNEKSISQTCQEK